MNNEQEFNTLRILEAALFASPDLLMVKELQPLFPEGTDIVALLQDLQKHYQGRGVEVVNRGREWGFRTAPDLADSLKNRQVVIKPLSRAATETMAIIAYHQPCTRAEIEQIRGVSISKSTLDILIEKDFVKAGRRREVPGRPLTWVTTDAFLDHFGLVNLRDLPNLKELKENGLLEIDPPVAPMAQEDVKTTLETEMISE